MDAAPTSNISWRDAIRTAHDFVGAKLALFLGDELLVYRRDRKPGIPHPGCWDLPGGGREGDESPFECAARELFEEFALPLDARQLRWARSYPGVSRPTSRSWFLVGEMTAADLAAVRFGDEGEEWRMMARAEFLNNIEAVHYLRDRLAEYIATEGTERMSPNAV